MHEVPVTVAFEAEDSDCVFCSVPILCVCCSLLVKGGRSIREL